MQDRKERSKPKNSQTSSNFDQLEREREREWISSNGFKRNRNMNINMIKKTLHYRASSRD